MLCYSLNVAFGVQAIIGALTTSLRVAPSGKSAGDLPHLPNNTEHATLVHHNPFFPVLPNLELGGRRGLTLAASCLTHTRSSNEPEFSQLPARPLNQLLPKVHAFKLGHGVGIHPTSASEA